MQIEKVNCGTVCELPREANKTTVWSLSHEAYHTIDNHGSGYLGMARCFNVHRQLPVSKETVISQHRKFLMKLGAPV